MNKSLSGFLVNIGVAAYLLAVGIMGCMENTGGFSFNRIKGAIAGNEITKAAHAIFSGNVATVVAVILSICAIAAGAFILLRFFGVSVSITEMLMLILMIVWVIMILLADIVPLFRGKVSFLSFLCSIGVHAMVLGCMAAATERFGG